MSPGAKRLALLAQYPEYCTVTDVARMLACNKRNVRHYLARIKHIEVDGMLLFDRRAAMQVASVYTKNPNAISRMGVTGVDVERLQKICEHYYRCQYDAAPRPLLKLAKRLAGL